MKEMEIFVEMCDVLIFCGAAYLERSARVVIELLMCIQG